MRFDGISPAAREQACAALARRAQMAGPAPVVRFLDCGTRMVRLICHSAAFLRHVERQMTCALREDAPGFDATLVIWQERSVAEAALAVVRVLDGTSYRRLRVGRLTGMAGAEAVQVFDEELLRRSAIPIIMPLRTSTPRSSSSADIFSCSCCSASATCRAAAWPMARWWG